MGRLWRPALLAALVALAWSAPGPAQDSATDPKKTYPDAEVGPPPRVVEAAGVLGPFLYDPFPYYPLPGYYGGFGPAFGGVGYYDAIPYLNPWWLDPYRGTFSVNTWGGCGCCCCGGAWPVIPPPIFIPNSVPQFTPYWPPAPVAYPVGLFARADRPAARETRPVSESASADRLYADGLTLFWDGNYKAARDHLAAAVKKDPRDARLWYYKALAERALGDTAAARTSAETGAALEITGVTERRTVLAALERVQGKERMEIEDLVKGPKALTVSKAEQIVARLTPADPTLARAR